MTNLEIVKTRLYEKKASLVVMFKNGEIKDFYNFTTNDIRVENYVTGPQIKNIPIAI